MYIYTHTCIYVHVQCVNSMFLSINLSYIFMYFDFHFIETMFRIYGDNTPSAAINISITQESDSESEDNGLDELMDVLFDEQSNTALASSSSVSGWVK